MSRIEIAMEKAALLKQVRAHVEVEPSAPIGTPSVSAQHGVLSPTNPFLVNLHDPHSPPAEEYRKLKSVLVEMTRTQDSFKNTVLVTSALPDEGKSLRR